MRTFARKPTTTQQTKSVGSTKTGRVFTGQSHKVNTILHLQRTIGNQAVQRLLLANAGELEEGSTIEKPSCFAHDFSQVPLHAKSHAKIQSKLTISTAGDIYEQEADRVADQVMHKPEPPLQRACACGGGCPKYSNEQSDRVQFQTKRVQTVGIYGTEVSPSVQKVLRSPGQPIDPATRTFFEPRFGHDFSQVRVHTSRQAADAARVLNARAFTVGYDVVFGAGEYKPNTLTGKLLLAHELTHVMQQRNSRHRIQRVAHAIAIPIIGVTVSVAAITDAVILILSAILATYALIRAYEFAVEHDFGVSLAQQALASGLGRITTAGMGLVALIEAVLEAARRTTNPSDPCRNAIRGLESALRDIISILGDIRRLSSADLVVIADIQGQCRLLAGTMETLWRIIQNIFNLCELAPRDVSDTAVRLSGPAIRSALQRIRDFFGSWGIQ